MGAFLDNTKQHIITSIAQELDCDCDCYYHKKTGEIISIPISLQNTDEEAFNEAFGDSMKKIEKSSNDFEKFEVLKDFELFKIIERFVEQLPDVPLKADLEHILANNKPFQNFKYQIDDSDFRENWFEFKQTELEKIVETQLDLLKKNNDL